MSLKINWSVKTPRHRSSMGVAHSGLWAPAPADGVLRTTIYTRYFEINNLMILASKCLKCINPPCIYHTQDMT